MTICQRANTWLSAYGKEGDGSFEYMGVVLSAHGVDEVRLYRKNSVSVTSALLRQPPYCTMAAQLSVFAALPEVKLCDISSRMAGDKPVYRVVYKLPRHLPKTSQDAYLDAFFVNLDVPDAKHRLTAELQPRFQERVCPESPLMQIGVEADADCRVQMLKYYFRPEGTVLDMTAFPHLAAPHEAICESGYKPIFWGVNDGRTGVEIKPYYISRSLGFQRVRLLAAEQEAIHRLGLQASLSDETLEELCTLGLYVEGIAASSRDSGQYRLYFSPLQR